MPNFNDKIRVRLTAHGIHAYEEYLRAIEKELPMLSEPRYREPLYATFNECRCGQPVEFQLWEFMHIFGKLFYNGAYVVDNHFDLVEG